MRRFVRSPFIHRPALLLLAVSIGLLGTAATTLGSDRTVLGELFSMDN